MHRRILKVVNEESLNFGMLMLTDDAPCTDLQREVSAFEDEPN